MGYEVGDQFKFEAEPITFGQCGAWGHEAIQGITFTLVAFTQDGAFAWLHGSDYREPTCQSKGILSGNQLGPTSKELGTIYADIAALGTSNRQALMPFSPHRAIYISAEELKKHSMCRSIKKQNNPY